MPQQVVCHKCGGTLYEGEELKPPYEITKEYDGRCPICDKKLSFTPIEFAIRRIER
jgi:hypothetical protein